MKYWGIVAVALYVLILVVILMPLVVWIVPNPGVAWGKELVSRMISLFSPAEDARGIWIYLGAVFLAQAALLSVPVEIAQKRPPTKRTIVPLVIASSMMMGLLAAGVALAINETVRKGDYDKISFLIIVAAFLFVWGFWAVIFFRWSKKMEPVGFLERQCKYLFRGSVLELLIAVPAHILARHRNYCCAGAQTFVGIAFGISVMLFSFGPGIFFLFVQRWQHLHRAR